MPKAKWQDLDADAIDSAESGGGNDYTGELPKGGLYRWTLVQAKQDTSKEGNDKIRWIWKLDGSWKDAHKEFDGCPLFDHMPMTKSAAFRAKQVCEALGITSRDLLNGVTDEEQVFTKFGSLVIKDKKVQAYINVKVEPANEGYDASLRVRGYVRKPDNEEAATAPEATPAKAAKAGKKAKEAAPEPEAKPAKESKKGKKAKGSDDEPPF